MRSSYQSQARANDKVFNRLTLKTHINTTQTEIRTYTTHTERLRNTIQSDKTKQGYTPPRTTPQDSLEISEEVGRLLFYL